MKIHAGKKLGETPALFFAGNKSARLLDWNNKIQMGFQSIGYVFIVQVSPNMNMTNTRCIHYVVGVDGWNLGHVWRRFGLNTRTQLQLQYMKLQQMQLKQNWYEEYNGELS